MATTSQSLHSSSSAMTVAESFAHHKISLVGFLIVRENPRSELGCRPTPNAPRIGELLDDHNSWQSPSGATRSPQSLSCSLFMICAHTAWGHKSSIKGELICPHSIVTHLDRQHVYIQYGRKKKGKGLMSCSIHALIMYLSGCYATALLMNATKFKSLIQGPLSK